MRVLRVTVAVSLGIIAASCAAVTGLGDFELVDCPEGCDAGSETSTNIQPLPDGGTTPVPPKKGNDGGPIVFGDDDDDDAGDGSDGGPPHGGTCASDSDCVGQATKVCAQDKSCHTSCEGDGATCSFFGEDCCIGLTCQPMNGSAIVGGCAPCIPSGGNVPVETGIPVNNACCNGTSFKGKCP